MRMRVYIFISIIFTVNLASFGLFFFWAPRKTSSPPMQQQPSLFFRFELNAQIGKLQNL